MHKLVNDSSFEAQDKPATGMNGKLVQDIVLGIIAVVAPDADLSNVKSDVRLRDQLDMDSMDFLDIVMELRKRYKVEVPEADYGHLASLDSCATYLEPKLKDK